MTALASAGTEPTRPNSPGSGRRYGPTTPANRGGRWCSVRVCGNRTKARPVPAPAPGTRPDAGPGPGGRPARPPPLRAASTRERPHPRGEGRRSRQP
ncbi:hypothetical protein [Kitasatospora sp. NPDC002965]|uniref:hypothetical protein n=1 Tax=Kitasatospora sp. NPDC002965 TaxID=3154775 RepID=UPI0033B13A85